MSGTLTKYLRVLSAVLFELCVVCVTEPDGSTGRDHT